MENARRKIARVKNDRVLPGYIPTLRFVLARLFSFFITAQKLWAPSVGALPIISYTEEPPPERGIPFSGLRFIKG